MSDFVHIEPADGQRRAFARWALSQKPKLQTSSSTGTDVPLDLYPHVPSELLEGAYVDGYLYGRVNAPQPPAAPSASAGVTPESSDSATGPQAAAQGVERKPRKRTPRKPRKATDTKLTAETIAAAIVASDSAGE